MAGHNGWGATGGGKLRNAKPMPIPAPGMSFVHAVGLASEVRRVAAELEMSPADVLARMRKDGVVDCNDEAAAIVLRFVDGQL